MKIAQVAPLHESVPPAKYGGTERVVSYLTEELVRQGHEVTLFASGDSKTSARLMPQGKRSLRTDPDCEDSLAPHVVMLEEVLRCADEFDVIHFHIDYIQYPAFSRIATRHLTTQHGRMDHASLQTVFRMYREAPLVSISNAQRTPIPWANWLGTVYHGLPLDLYRYTETAGRYLAFVGRISPEKGLDKAIEIARRAGMPLKIAAKVDKQDREYFDEIIRPLLNDSSIEFLEEVGDPEKQELLGEAAALLFPINWPEPFGIVMIEAMACGTPVIAFPCGAVPEVINEGATGFLVNNVDEAVEAIGKLPSLSRKLCREVFERRFSSTRMARDYCALYEKLQAGEHSVELEVRQCL